MSGINPNKRLYLKPLYLAKNIEHLQSFIPECTSILPLPCKKPMLFVQVSQKLLAEAKESETIGDQEKAYIYFFKYCEVTKTIRRTPEYKKDKLYYDCMVSPKSVKDALDDLDKLTNILTERYNEKDMKLQTSDQGQSLTNLDLLEDFFTERREALDNMIDTMKSQSKGMNLGFKKTSAQNQNSDSARRQEIKDFFKERQKALDTMIDNVKNQSKGMNLGFKKTSAQNQNSDSARRQEIKEKLQAEVDTQNEILKNLILGGDLSKSYEDQHLIEISKLEDQIRSFQENGNVLLKMSEDRNLTLERKNRDLQDSRMCKVCMDKEVSQVFNPCHHAICCENCAKSIQKCPICRKNIENKHTIYFS